MPMEHIVFVYGTLQRGQTDYPFWLGDAREAEFLGAARTLCAYPRYVHLLPCHQDCLPCVANQPSSVTANDPVRAHIYGEAFRVSTRMKAWLDILAEVRGYEAKDTRIIMPIPSTTSPDGVVACMYCSTGPHPEACTEESSCGLLPESEPFSSAWCLSAYGSRFSGAVPAHLSADAPALHQRLCALPPSLRPSAVEADARYAAPLVPPPMIIFIIDGIGDNTYPELKGRTPLEWVSGAPPPPVRADGAPTHGLPPCLQPVLLKGSPLPRVETEAGLNCLTQAGVSGMMDPYMAGMSCGSDTAHLSLFGYPPPQYYRGRGAYEALGAGLDLGDEDVAFKSNFATFADPDEDEGAVGSPAVEAASGRMLVSHRRCDRDFTVEGPLLCKDLHGTLVERDLHGVPFDYPHMIKIQYATEHRCGVALSGARQGPGGKLGRLSDAITGTDPLKDGRYLLRCEPTVPPDHAEYEAAVYTCRLVEAASAKLTAMLKAHPINAARRRANCEAAERGDVTRKLVANLILFRGAAKKGWVPPFEVRHGLKGFIAAPTCIIKGLGMCCGLSGTSCLACYPTVDGPQGMDGATGDYFSNLEVKVDAVLHALRLQCPATHPTSATHAEISPFNIAILHVKGVDDAGHDANLAMKAEMLRRCGKAMQRLWNSLPPGSTMAVIADHSTPLAISDHCCEPVPVSVATKPMPGQTVPPYADGVQFYSEILAQGGGLGRFRGEELIPLLKRAHAFAHYSQQHPLRN